MGRPGLVLTGLYDLHPVLPLDVGVEGGHIDGGEDGALWEGPDVFEEPEKVRSVLQVGLVLPADILDLVLDVVTDVLSYGPFVLCYAICRQYFKERFQ